MNFLKVLTAALEEEYSGIIFDYSGFYRSTWRLLIEIRDHCLPLVERYVGHRLAPLTEHAGLTFLPALIMMTACDVSKAPNLKAVLGEGHVRDDRPMREAAEVMKSFIWGGRWCFLQERGDEEEDC